MTEEPKLSENINYLNTQSGTLTPFQEVNPDHFHRRGSPCAICEERDKNCQSKLAELQKRIDFFKNEENTTTRNCAPPNDPVNHPKHYTSLGAKCICDRPIECIDVTRHLTFNLGNAVKYIWRCHEKSNAIQDLEKSIWYLQDEIVRLKKLYKEGLSEI